MEDSVSRWIQHAANWNWSWIVREKFRTSHVHRCNIHFKQRMARAMKHSICTFLFNLHFEINSNISLYQEKGEFTSIKMVFVNYIKSFIINQKCKLNKHLLFHYNIYSYEKEHPKHVRIRCTWLGIRWNLHILHQKEWLGEVDLILSNMMYHSNIYIIK